MKITGRYAPCLPRYMAHWLSSSSPALRLADGLQVQLVESDEEQLTIHRRALEQAGAIVFATSSGVEAMRLARAAELDVLVCDTTLEVLDGFRLLRMLRRMRPELEQLGAIALASRRDEDDISAALRAGFDLHAVKPLAACDLVQMVAALGKRPQPLACAGALKLTG